MAMENRRYRIVNKDKNIEIFVYATGPVTALDRLHKMLNLDNPGMFTIYGKVVKYDNGLQLEIYYEP